MADPDSIRGRALRALATVVAVAVGVGVILAVGAYAAARMAGLTDGGGSGNSRAASAAGSAAPSPTTPPKTASTARDQPAQAQHRAAPRQTSQTAHAERSHPSQPRPQRHSTPNVRHHRHPHHHRRPEHRRHRRGRASGVLTLHASQTRVRPMGRVDLGGRCGCRTGTRLVVQRREHGHWSRFPATATASRGAFHTWVMTGRHGQNQFRVVVPGGRASNPVTIMVG